MSNSMQLISIILFLFSLAALVGAIVFVVSWQRNSRHSSLVHQLREGIAHIGVSAVVEYPETTAPLVALLEEEYPRSEAVVVTDLEQARSTFGELISRYHLIRVNHSHLDGVRALYRSRHRAYRRVVVVDLPTEHREQAAKIGKRVASYDYTLHLQGESIVEPDAITYCANLIASQHSSTAILLRSIVGASAYLEKGLHNPSGRALQLYADHALAWQRGGVGVALTALLLPMAIVVAAHLSGSWLLFISAAITMVAIGLFLYVSCRVVTEKGIFIRLDTILRNFYRYLIERVENFYYLYKGREYGNSALTKGISILQNRQRNHNRRAL